MDNLAIDLESAIWSKFGVNSTPSDSPASYIVDAEVTDGDSSRDQALQEAVLGQTICYIAAAVVVHEGRVLMMREAKRSCRGAWYLPAGRVERDESLEEGVIREVLEETGLHFEPTSIICINSQGTSWFRFTFVGSITGGKLKTLQEQDKESMEAGWFTPKEVFSSLNLRAGDICPLIDAGLKWYETKQGKPTCRLMPAKKSHKHVIIRLVVVKRLQQNGNRSLYCVLFCNKMANNLCPCFPYTVISNTNRVNVSTVIDRIVKDIDSRMTYKTCGYLNVEHTGKPFGVADGLCLTVLVEVFNIPVENGILNEKYQWFEVEEMNLTEKIWELMETEGCVKLVQF